MTLTDTPNKNKIETRHIEYEGMKGKTETAISSRSLFSKIDKTAIRKWKFETNPIQKAKILTLSFT